MSAALVLVVTIALIALSAFFVVIEFALLGARRHRLEEMAPESASKASVAPAPSCTTTAP